MSALWSLLYIDTECAAADVLAALDSVCVEIVDGNVALEVWRHDRLATISLDDHDVVSQPGRETAAQIERTGNPCLVVYPRHEGLVTVGLLGWFSPEQLLEATPVGWDAGARSDRWGNDTAVAAIPRLALLLSSDLHADVALLTYVRNPAVEATSLWFARGGQWASHYFRQDVEGQTATLQWAQRAGELFNGRFRFVTGVDAPPPDRGRATAFHAEDMYLGRGTVPSGWTTYDPAARLYVPFWEGSLSPAGAIVYDLDALTAPSDGGTVAIRAALPRPPLAIQPHAPARPERLLRLLTRNVPTGKAGLQFRDEASGEASIIFDMEVDWLSPRRVELDMGLVDGLLWPQRRVLLRVRIMDCEDARYVPLTPWSEPVLRLG